MADKIKLCISSCLLGNKVRYDGGHKLDPYLKNTLGRFIEWVPVCPEVEAGLPVPREPMQLVAGKESLRLITIETEQDKTRAFSRWSRTRLKQLDSAEISGFLFKARSPSCGVYDTRIVDSSGCVIGKGAGLFAAAVSNRWLHIPQEDEDRLQDAGIRENFIERVFVYQRWRELPATGDDAGKLVDFHTRHKLQLMSHSIRHLRLLGALVADTRKKRRADLYDAYIPVLMDGLRLPATIKKHTNVLQHMAGYFKKQLPGDEKRELHDLIKRYHDGLAPLIAPITLIKHYAYKHAEPYLQQQHYLSPHPLEIMLRNHA
jgi:uncharacterized protein YbgA (DUF1722 family)/uncharacterized protein YbbK (DUF523 family)